MSEDLDEGNNNRMATLEFQGVRYDVELIISNETLTIQVENSETFEQWVGTYDVPYIEELTHKTGNFKQFSIFCNMLDSAVLQNTESVTLDLLTYEDLKVLREQKLGNKNNYKRKHITDNKLSTKRYLIMTYSVEFDQIHYPLPLIYNGVIDPVQLKSQLHELKIENKKLRRNAFQGSNIEGIEEDYEKVLLENKQLKKELLQCRQHLNETSNTNVSKELKVLQKLVKSLEADLLKEKSKSQRVLNKKIKEYNELLEEFEELKANERNYRIRCKNLTSELAVLKRNSRISPQIAKEKIRTKSDNTIPKNNSNINRYRQYPNSTTRGRSRDRSLSQNSGRSISNSSRARTPSPGYKRFDPSAYVKKQKEKQKQVEVERGRRRTPTSVLSRKSRTSSGSRYDKPPLGGARNRSLSNSNKVNTYNRKHSYGSDTDSLSRLKGGKENTKRRVRRRPSKTYSIESDLSEEENYTRRRQKKSNAYRSSSQESYKNLPKDNQREEAHAIGIEEIDARLEALQKFMKDNMD